MKGIGGIACAVNLPGASELVQTCLELQENRGADALKIASIKDGVFCEESKLIADGESFHGYDFARLPGKVAIGFNTDFRDISRISRDDIQPLVVTSSRFGTIAIAQCGFGSNGNNKLKEEIKKRGGVFHSRIEAETILHQITLSRESIIENAIISALNQVPIVQPLVILTRDKLFAVQDTYGFHPLSLGRLDGGFLICSENAIFAHLEAEHMQEIEPGEIIMFSKDNCEPKNLRYADSNEHLCICGGIYIANPRTMYRGILHETFRELLGIKLFRENRKMRKYFILPILNSGKNQSGGFHKKSKIPKKEYLLKSSDRSRTKKSLPFPASLFHENVRRNSLRKYHLREDKIVGRHAIVVDCIMRTGVGMRVINERLKEARIKKISTYFAAPPVVRPCPYDKMLHPDKSYLLAANFAPEQMLEKTKEVLLSDDIYFLSIESLNEAVKETYGCSVCTGCLLGGSCPV